MRRILLVHQPVDGGVGRHVLDVYEGLSDAGYDVVLCGPGLPGGSSLADGRLRGAAHRALAMQRAVAPRADVSALTRYGEIIRSVKPSLVHAHSSKAGAIARLGKLAYSSAPVLYTPHGYAFAGYFDRPLERLAYREAERSLTPLTRRVVAVCRAEASLAATVCPRRRIRVVHNGIDVPAAVKQRADRPTGGPIICTVTRLRPGKGLETLIDAVPDVIARHPAARVVIVGGGPLRDELAARVRARSVEHAVEFLGEHPDPRAVLRGANVFVLPSLAESFPYVVLEAMSQALPVVATDVGGIGEAVVDGESGLLVQAGDARGLARSLRTLLDDDPLRARLGARGRSEVEQRFTKARMIAGLSAVYEEVLSEGR